MCGIVGCIGENIKKTLIDGLKELEYRGYDSSGIAILSENDLFIKKTIGKIKNLELASKDYINKDKSIGIGHTRWATHGKPTDINAHPHLGEFSFVIHNGIIENFQELKKDFNEDLFLSQTDTEVIIHLFEKKFNELKNELEAFKATIKKLKGSYAILLISKTSKENIYFSKLNSPLAIGKDDNNNYSLASSDLAMENNINKIIHLDDGDYGLVSRDGISLFNGENKKDVQFQALNSNKLFSQKEGYRFFMEKEIYEQSSVICDTLANRITDKISFDEIDIDISKFSSIIICACGTSYHAALSAKYLFEQIAQISTNIEIASEFRYREPILHKNSLFISISQSGETADTLECLKMVKKMGLETLAICNVDNSAIVRLSDNYILTRAGFEKGVASTKSFTTQLAILWMFSIFIAQEKNIISKAFLEKEIKALLELYLVLEVPKTLHERIHRLSKRYLHGHGFFFIARDIFYPLALEGALKLKEISYFHAEGYPAGEMKHGPIALADPELFTIALLPTSRLYEKMKSNIQELIARDSTVCIVGSKDKDLADDFIEIKEYSHQMHEYFSMTIALQLLSMEIALRLGHDVDMPRNLAKSVTVE